ncbi:MAG: hypothetical protein M1830_005573 [Pleopsidium flavum]|nr:MAG: hypothetical protein M1830_005573 [Pleopsidium flavum]
MCDLDFWTAEQLEDHDGEEHSEYEEDESDEGYESEDSDSGDEDELYCFGCDRSVESFSAMLVHLESGNCDCGTTRDELNRLALRCPFSSRYVVRGREEHLRQGQTYRRARPSHYNSRTHYYECPWCNFSGKSLYNLDMHLLSPVHDVKAFICPDADCRQLFVNLSGLVAHVESYRCEEGIWVGSGSIIKMLDYLDGRLPS